MVIRFIAELRTNFDFNDYPLDRQNIIIKLEPYLYWDSLYCFSVPAQNVFIDKLNLNGWNADTIIANNNIAEYVVYEYTGYKTYKYSQVSFEIPICRKNYFFYLIKFFLPSLISILIIYIGFILTPSQIESRLNLSVGSLFVMISNFIVTQQMLPDISTITLIEKINIVSLVIIFLTILFFSISFKFKEQFKNKVWYRINLFFVIVTIISYSLFLMILL